MGNKPLIEKNEDLVARRIDVNPCLNMLKIDKASMCWKEKSPGLNVSKIRCLKEMEQCLWKEDGMLRGGHVCVCVSHFSGKPCICVGR